MATEEQTVLEQKEETVELSKEENIISGDKKKHEKIVEKLIALLNNHTGWAEILKSSLQEACRKAKDELKETEREHFKPFPDTLEKYFNYLDNFVRLIPTEQDYAKEVYFQLCKFYWLIDQPAGRELQTYDEFNQWMADFANDWGKFLDTTESLTQESLRSFYEEPEYNLEQYVGYDPDWKTKKEIQHKTWMTFNQFFSRNVKPGLRPVAGMFDDNIIISPADSTFKKKFKIDNESEVTIKHTHKYKIDKLLEGSKYKDRFRDGLFMHNFLGPSDFHRFHAPVRGTVLESRAIQERVYLDVQINDGKFDAPDGAGYEFSQTRGIIILDSPIGLVAVLPIGMAQVSSVNMTAVEGSYLNKGDEFGYFQFGGSDIILLFEEKSNVIINSAPMIHYNTGMCIGETKK